MDITTSDEQEKLRILITDDSRLLRKKLREDLEKLGCEVIEAVNGKESITLVLEQDPDGVFMDIVMDEINGIETARSSFGNGVSEEEESVIVSLEIPEEVTLPKDFSSQFEKLCE